MYFGKQCWPHIGLLITSDLSASIHISIPKAQSSVYNSTSYSCIYSFYLECVLSFFYLYMHVIVFSPLLFHGQDMNKVNKLYALQ